MLGTEVRRTLPDDSWLIHKHRDIVQDFSDVDSSEKEYIMEWDTFIQTKRVVSEAYIGRAVEEFVVDKVDWLLESKTRTLQFGKHLTVLVARGVDEDIIKLVQAKLRDARFQRLVAPAPTAQPRKELPKRKGKGCAVCGQVVRGPSLLICANKVRLLPFVVIFRASWRRTTTDSFVQGACKRPIYHDKCVRATARMAIEHPRWRCNDCTR